MGDAARQLSQGPQALLLHHGLLGQPQVVVGLLERAVEMGLVGGQGGLLGQLAQEIPVEGAEGVGLPARRHEHAEDLALHDQRAP